MKFLVAAIVALAIKVTPGVLYSGQSVRIVCSVARHADNRYVAASLNDYTISERPLNGESGPVTNTFTFDHVPCIVDTASCIVIRTSGSIVRTAPLTVNCSQENP